MYVTIHVHLYIHAHTRYSPAQPDSPLRESGYVRLVVMSHQPHHTLQYQHTGNKTNNVPPDGFVHK